jgi:hypothetical protein
VSKVGQQVLQLAGLELSPVPVSPLRSSQSAALPHHSGSGPLTTLTQAASLPVGLSAAGLAGTSAGAGVGSSLGSLTQKFVKSSRSWRSGFASTANARTVPTSSSSSSTERLAGSSPPSPQQDGPAGVTGAGVTPAVAAAAAAASGSSAAAMAAVGGLLLSGHSRTPFILRCIGATAEGPGYGGGVGSSSGSSRGGGSGGYPGGVGVDQEGVPGLPELPPSQVYKLSCEYFSRPMLEPQVRGQEGT